MEKWGIFEIKREKYSNALKKMVLEYVSKNGLDPASEVHSRKKRIDTDTKKLLLYLFTATRGGINRLRIVLLLMKKPRNAYQLSKALGLDYNAIEYHVDWLENNNLILREGKKYGAIYRLSTYLEYNIESFNEIIVQLFKEFKKGPEMTKDKREEVA